MHDYVSFREFAELAGVSVQTVYKRAKTPPLASYVRPGVPRTLSVEALSLFQPSLKPRLNEDLNVQAEALNGGLKCENSEMAEAVRALRDQLAAKDAQLAEKDRQIERLQAMLSKAIDTTAAGLLTTAQQQQLAAIEATEQPESPPVPARRAEKPWYRRLFS